MLTWPLHGSNGRELSVLSLFLPGVSGRFAVGMT
jgi:hypothetical protein